MESRHTGQHYSNKRHVFNSFQSVMMAFLSWSPIQHSTVEIRAVGKDLATEIGLWAFLEERPTVLLRRIFLSRSPSPQRSASPKGLQTRLMPSAFSVHIHWEEKSLLLLSLQTSHHAKAHPWLSVSTVCGVWQFFCSTRFWHGRFISMGRLLQQAYGILGLKWDQKHLILVCNKSMFIVMSQDSKLFLEEVHYGSFSSQPIRNTEGVRVMYKVQLLEFRRAKYNLSLLLREDNNFNREEPETRCTNSHNVVTKHIPNLKLQ